MDSVGRVHRLWIGYTRIEEMTTEPNEPHHPTVTPSFVLSLPRTGSTLLRLLLDTHDEVFAPDELRLGRLCSALFGALEGLEESSQRAAGRQTELEESHGVLEETRRVVGGRMARATHERGKRVWCEKSPENLTYHRLLRQVFPTARFLLLHRHALDFVTSCLRASPYGFSLPVVGRYLEGQRRAFLPALVRAWVEQSEVMLALEETLGESALRVRYEDLVADPQTVLAGINHHLGVVHDPGLVDRVFAVRHHQRDKAGDGNALFSTKVSTAGVGRGRSLPWSMIEALPAELRQKMNETLQRLAYPPVENEDWTTGVEAGPTGTPTGTSEPDEGSRSLRRIFEEQIPQRLAAELPSALEGLVCAFVVDGPGGGRWVLDLRRSPARVLTGEAPASAEVRIDARELLAIAEGTSNPAAAHREGRLRVSGAIGLEALRALVLLLVL